MRHRLIAFVLPIACAACASAPSGPGSAAVAVKAERPNVKVGDKYTETCTQGMSPYDRQTVITAVDESGIKFTRSGMLLENTRDLNPVKDERFSFSDRHYFNFPLEVGKRWTFTDHWARSDIPDNGTSKGTVTVTAYEKVRVVAGEFDAFKIEWSADFTDVMGHAGTNAGMFWYAPAARKTVKSMVSIVGEPISSCEVKEFQLQP